MIAGLNHVNLRATAELLLELRDFYLALGFELGPRPAFNTPGYWLYAGGQPVLHLSQQAASETPRQRLPQGPVNTFDHFALVGPDAASCAARLHAMRVPFQEERSTLTGQHQFFFSDPAGNSVEINVPFD